MTPPSRPLVAAVVAAAGLLLSGCTGSDPGPGVAASVGDAEVSLAEVDRLTAGYCEGSRAQYRADSVAVPMGLLRAQVVQNLVAREIATQIAAEHGVEAGTTYERQLNALRKGTASYGEAAAEAKIEVESVNAYVQDILDAAAEKELAEAGRGDASSQQVQRRAVQIFTGWDGDVEIDPRFGITFEDGTFAPSESGGLSQAVGEAATRSQVLDKFATAQDPAQQQALQQQVVSYAQSLPSSQRCG